MSAAKRLNSERILIEEVAADVSISRLLGDELIDASREAVAAWYEPHKATRVVRLRVAIVKLERLVGRPHE